MLGTPFGLPSSSLGTPFGRSTNFPFMNAIVAVIAMKAMMLITSHGVIMSLDSNNGILFNIDEVGTAPDTSKYFLKEIWCCHGVIMSLDSNNGILCLSEGEAGLPEGEAGRLQ